VDDETLALDTIAAVGPGGEFSYPENIPLNIFARLFRLNSMDRRPYGEWETKQTMHVMGPCQGSQDPVDTPTRSLDEKISAENGKDYLIPGILILLQCNPSLNFLQPDLIARILDEAFQLMQHPGIKIQSSAARQLLVSAGAICRREILVNIPEGIVRKALDTFPKNFFLYDRDGQPKVHYGGDTVQFDPGSSGGSYPGSG